MTKYSRTLRSMCLSAFATVALLSASAAHATVVEVRTVLGNFQINLFDETTPQTVDNFLSYVNSGAYANNVVHRSVPNFITQMGGFEYSAFPPSAIATGTPVLNEPKLSNLRGTVAMAKVGGNANSATSQFFVNLANNSANLDQQNGGFTVFGQVIGDGMTVVDAIAALNTFNLGGAFTDTPLRAYTASDFSANTEPTDDNFVIITDIVIVDANTVTNPTLNPVANTLINGSGSPQASSSSGGSIGFGLALGLLLVSFRRIVKA